MRQIFFFVLAVACLALPQTAFSADVTATVSKITGKAQIQKGEDWVPLSIGDLISLGDTVSTGFRSELQVKIGTSIVTLKALSRLTLRELTHSGTDLQTDVYLRVGKVEAQVNKSESVKTQTFKISSPVATASVRGTSLGSDGYTFEGIEGHYTVTDSNGNTTTVSAGESARAPTPGTNEILAGNLTIVTQNSVVTAQAGSDFGQDSTSSSGDYFSWDSSSSWDLYSYYYDWNGTPGATHLSIGGIIPAPVPIATHISIGGITPTPVPVTTYVSIGGITP